MDVSTGRQLGIKNHKYLDELLRELDIVQQTDPERLCHASVLLSKEIEEVRKNLSNQPANESSDSPAEHVAMNDSNRCHQCGRDYEVSNPSSEEHDDGQKLLKEIEAYMAKLKEEGVDMEESSDSSVHECSLFPRSASRESVIEHMDNA